MQSTNPVIDPERIEYVKKNIKSYPDDERSNLLKNKPWWKNNHTTINNYLSSIINGS